MNVEIAPGIFRQVPLEVESAGGPAIEAWVAGQVAELQASKATEAPAETPAPAPKARTR